MTAILQSSISNCFFVKSLGCSSNCAVCHFFVFLCDYFSPQSMKNSQAEIRNFLKFASRKRQKFLQITEIFHPIQHLNVPATCCCTFHVFRLFWFHFLGRVVINVVSRYSKLAIRYATILVSFTAPPSGELHY